MRYHVVFPFTDRAAAEEFLGEQRESGWSGVILGPEGDEIPSSRPALRVVEKDTFSVAVELLDDKERAGS